MIKGHVAPETIDRILQRLTSDEDFRERFIGDPADALGEYQVEVDVGRIPTVRRLPSRERIAAIREQAAGVADPLTKVGLTFFLLK